MPMFIIQSLTIPLTREFRSKILLHCSVIRSTIFQALINIKNNGVANPVVLKVNYYSIAIVFFLKGS